MRDNKLSLATLALLAVASATVQASSSTRRQPGDEAQDLLMRSMEHGKQIPVVAILYQRSIGGSSASMQVKVEQSKDGRTKLTVLQPLSMEGVTYVDDGRHLRTYLPDVQHQIVQKSPRLMHQDLKERMAIASQNYTFKLEQQVTIAGRKARRVVAIPKAKDMPTRRYYIDEDTAFLLRLEKVAAASKAAEVQLDTKLIRYPKNLPKQTFEFNMIKEPRKFNCPSPALIANAASVKPKLGFTPVVPKTLPYGFAVQEPQIAGGDGFHFAAIRLTDGLVNATVYQWSGNRRDLPKGFQHQEGDEMARGVKFRVVGDVSDRAKKRLVELFVREAMKSTKMLAEPIQPTTALKGERRELINMLLYSIQNAVVEEQTAHTGMCAFSRTAGL